MRPNASVCQLTIEPESEPISISQAKAHLRVDGSDEDAYLTSLITVARQKIETEIRRALIKQQWVAYITGGFGTCLPVELPRARLMDAETLLLEYRNTIGNWVPWTDLLKQASREPALLWATAVPGSIDSPRSAQDAVWRVSFYAGYGDNADAVPGPIKHAILVLVAHLFERKEVVISGATVSEIPKSLDWLLDQYRVPWEGAVK